MYWARDTVNPMLALRTIACDDRWEEAWPQICEQLRLAKHEQSRERRRNRQEQSTAANRQESPVAAPVEKQRPAAPVTAQPAAANPAMPHTTSPPREGRDHPVRARPVRAMSL